MFAHNAANDEQSQAGAFFFGGVERLEQVSHLFWRDTGSGVADADADFIIGEIAANSDFSARRGGLGGVADEVIKRLFHLPGVDPQQRQIGAQFEL